MTATPEAPLDVERRSRVARGLVAVGRTPVAIGRLLNAVTAADWNPSADKPYHGAQHLLTVAGRAYEGGRAHGFTAGGCWQLLLAGLFHDVGYREVDDDWDNIEVAVAALRRAHSEELLKPGTAADVDAAQLLIESTCYPYRRPSQSLAESILRDADLMQSLEKDAPRWMAGLAAETGQPVTPASTRAFIERTGLHTEWARSIFRRAGYAD